VHPQLDGDEARAAVKPASYPVSYVYVHYTTIEDGGQAHIVRFVTAHDGAAQACEEAIRAVGFDPLPQGIRVREIEVFAGVEPRRFFHEPVVRRTFQLKEA
jgi:hypothetical protein